MPSKSGILKAIEEAFDCPVYVVSTNGVCHTVDKIQFKKRKVVSESRKRHIVNSSQCSCIGFLKDKQCKHLAMVNGTFTVEGVPSSVAYTEVLRILDKLKMALPAQVNSWVNDPTTLPEKIDQVAFDFDTDSATDCTVYAVREFPVGKFVIRFNLVKKKD